MLALSFTFPAGRYHATPWDRHVNEGAVAWPPEPWRILRALIATWHHKVKHAGRHEEATLLGLIESLAQELPNYDLPAANHSHTRHYMPQFHVEKKNNNSLIFDAFTAVNPNEPLNVIWPNVELSDDQRELLDELLSVMGYLGRAESWVDARRITEAPKANCTPGTRALDTETGELKGETVTLYAPISASEYQTLRKGFLADKKQAKKLARTLPDNLLDALSVDMADLRKHGWNQPPAAQKVNYLRPLDALKPQYTIPNIRIPEATSAQFILVGKPLPQVTETLRIGELMRQAVMAQAKRLFGENSIPPIFSGHGMPENNRHGHAFYLPWDSNGDGYIDRVLVHVPAGVPQQERKAIEHIRQLWSRDGAKWRLVLEAIGTAEVGGAMTLSSTSWESVTPYLHPWHVKKRFGVKEQIKRECRERGLPKPDMVEPLEAVEAGKNRHLRPIQFRRFRNRRGLTQPDRHGSFWRLTFPEPVTGPLALGFGCHFGLGLFAPRYTPKGTGD